MPKVIYNYAWVPRVATKRASFLWGYFWARLTGKKYYTDEGVQLTYKSPYHHAMAKAASLGEIEPEMMDVWCEKALVSNTIYDVGGFNGIYGLTAAMLNPDAQVTIFEPDRINVRNIQANIEANNLYNVHAYLHALADHNGGIALNPRGTTYTRTGEGDDFIRCSTLNEYPAPDLIKIDTGGAEVDIILNGLQALKNKPTLLLQTDKKSEAKWDDMFEALLNLGYRQTFYEEIPSGGRYIFE